MDEREELQALRRLAELEDKAAAEKGGIPVPSLVLPDQGIGRSLVNGAGKFVNDIVAGTKQTWNAATGNDAANAQLAREQERVKAGYAPLQRANPVATSVGESLFPAVASIPFTGGSGLAGTLTTGFLTGAIPEALKYGSPEERMANALKSGAGGAAGAGLGYGVAKMIQPVSNAARLSPEAQQAADRIGYKLTAGELQQNEALQNIENWLRRTPGSSGTMQARQAANQQAINRAAAGAMGETADDLGEKTFAAAKGRIGSEFQRLSAAAAPDVQNSPDFINAIVKVDAANRATQSYMRPDITKEVEKALDLASTGKLSGEAYQQIRSQLSSDAQRAFAAKDSTLGKALETIRNGLDAAANQSLSAADQEAYKVARQQWAAYKALTKGAVAEGGDVSGKRLAAALRQANPDAFRTGQMKVDERLMDIARLSEALKGVSNPNSGQMTVTAAMMQNPLTAIPMALNNKMLSKALMNPVTQGYLSSDVLSPAMARYLKMTTVPAGIAAATSSQQ